MTKQKPRPEPHTAYRPEFCNRLIELRKDGLTFKAIAGVFGVTKRTLNNWRKKHPEFAQAMATATGTKQEIRNRAINLRKNGLTYKGVARELRLSIVTLRHWRKEHPEFGEAMQTRKPPRNRLGDLAKRPTCG